MALPRRAFLPLLAAAPSALWAATPEKAGRQLDFRVGVGFGEADEADIRAVLLSAAGALWEHCPATEWRQPGFFIYNTPESPITLYELRADGRIAIGLKTHGRLWSQYAFQFAHEFCHALAMHSNDAAETWVRGVRPNHWLEESLCETASLFALRAMSRSWQTAPPYPNWKAYAPALAQYAQDRMEAATGELAKTGTFALWFGQNEAAMREKSTLREKNSVVAGQLLPLFEADPEGWEAVTFFDRVPRDPEETLAKHLRGWSSAAPARLRAFIAKVAAVFAATW